MSSGKKVHIIAFDNPYPPDYGGAIDVFFKIKHLHAIGVRITLHVFEYGRPPRKELERYCEAVYYYKRKRLSGIFSFRPYIVAGRQHEELLQRLLSDEAPILFEGLHTCFYLDHPALKGRNKVVRMHNIEHEYYGSLARAETQLFKKLFFTWEAKRLGRFEKILRYADQIVAISPNDASYLSGLYKQVSCITAFHANEQVNVLTGKGNYAFYHGKLSIGENDEAARFLVNEVFTKTDKPLWIAGNQPSRALRDAIAGSPHIRLFDGLNTEEIGEMIAHAHVNVLPTFQATGIKLKLINVLYRGRFVLVNDPMVSNTGCESLCTIANASDEMARAIDMLFDKVFTESDLEQRTHVISRLFDNEANAYRLAALL